STWSAVPLGTSATGLASTCSTCSRRSATTTRGCCAAGRTSPRRCSERAALSTIVYCHAHPDDEASQTSGAMARAAAEGHRVVVVFATNGDHGEVAADAVEGETVADYRRREAEVSARVLGLARIAWLGYADSGMTGWEQNDAETSFYRADLDVAARRL